MEKLIMYFTILIWCFESNTDDRTKYASIQAILYGPYLLAGHTTGDWNIKTAANASIADWITPIPPSYNTHLFYSSQAFANSTFVLTNSNQSLAVKKVPEPGTDSALGATFRVIQGKSSTKFTTLTDAIGKSVMLEPFDHPGMQVIHQGIELPLTVVGSSLWWTIFCFCCGTGIGWTKRNHIFRIQKP